jgi:peptidoglycan/LPS O-acetylase OafA/YrhL
LGAGQRFAALKGLRLRLAGAVVFSHIAQARGPGVHGGHAVWLDQAGEAAAFVFVAITLGQVPPEFMQQVVERPFMARGARLARTRPRPAGVA